VAGLPDLDGDGHGDVAIGAVSRTEPRGIDQVFLYSGRSGRELAGFSDRVPGSGFGSLIVPCARRDGSLLLAIGIPNGRRGTGGAFDFCQANGARWSTWSLPAASGAFGDALVTLPDTDGDGWPELLALGADGQGGWLFRIGSSTSYRLQAR
jgi:hypothetical protein